MRVDVNQKESLPARECGLKLYAHRFYESRRKMDQIFKSRNQKMTSTMR